MHTKTREQVRTERFLLTDDATTQIKKASRETGIFEVHAEDFAELLDNAGLAHFDHATGMLRMQAQPLCMPSSTGALTRRARTTGRR